MPIQHNQTWDSEGNLIFEEYVEVPEPEVDPREAALAKLAALGLTEREIAALLA